MQLAAILDQYHDAFQAKYTSRLLPGHLRAINAINSVPRKWVVDCTHAGKNLSALKYLSRFVR